MSGLSFSDNYLDNGYNSDYSQRGQTQSEEEEQYRQDCGYDDDENDPYYSDNHYDDPYYSDNDYDKPSCISCKRDDYPLTSDGKCERCWRSISTIYDMKSPLATELFDHVLSFLGIKINHALRVQEHKSHDKVCWRFKRRGKCPFGKYCRFVHVVKRPSSCLYFLKGRCHFGEVCHFTHRSPKLCQWFLKGRCHFGDKCRLTHRSPKLCQWFLKGRCHFGDKCRFSHKR